MQAWRMLGELEGDAGRNSQPDLDAVLAELAAEGDQPAS